MRHKEIEEFLRNEQILSQQSIETCCYYAEGVTLKRIVNFFKMEFYSGAMYLL